MNSVPNIRNLRLAAGLSQEGLARRADVSLATIERLEKGKGAYPETLRAVARALDCSLDELFLEEGVAS